MRELLADEGSIYIHIDCKIGHYVKIIMDEIFGRNRYVNDITRIKCNPKNFKRKGYGNIKDMVLFYTKTDKYMWNDPREAFSEGDIERLFTKIDEAGRRYTTTPLHAPGETRNGPTGGLWKGIKPPKGRHWRCKPEELEKIDRQGLIEWSPTGNPRKKIFAEEIFGKGKKRQDIWEFKDHPYPSYPTEKNIEMLKMIIDTSSNVDDLILDCFSGSGSTLLAAELTKRRWIGIDNSSIAIDVSRRRIKALEGFSPFTIHHIVDNL
jgi:adenine-specific DNA-methyltransferase